MPDILIDSALSRDDALRGSLAPAPILDMLQVLAVPYLGFDEQLHRGQIVVARDLAEEVADIFAALHELRFPIERVIPVAQFAWSDDASMSANNSSGFNYRAIVGGQNLSHHATGRAIDLNPRQNPYLRPNLHGPDLILPPGAVYDARKKGTLSADSAAVRVFETRGWEWGGRWTTRFDYHHFQKP